MPNYQTKIISAETIAAQSNANSVYGVSLQGGWPHGLGNSLGAASSGFPGIATGTTTIRSTPSATGKAIGTLQKGSQVTVVAMKLPYSQLSSGGWVDARYITDNPNAYPSDGVQALQSALADLASLGYQTDPKETNGVVGFGTVSALATALGVVAGEIKGGQTTALALQAALHTALISKSVDTRARDAIRAAAKPLAIAVQIFVAKKRGAAGGFYTGDMPGGGSAWNPTTIALAALGGIVVLGGLYVILKK